ELKQRKEKEEPLQKGTERILFVDDEFNITNIYEEMFTIMGYSTTTRNSSTKALELFSKDPSKFDLIITDQTMPNLTGLKLAEKIKLIRKNIPIILCTGFSEAVNFDSTKNRNIDKIIQKPMQINEFLKTIRQVLDNKKYI
ncbi:MAG: response regulator, partial [Candidatus Aminicenantes bacterium]|nr:response regulator [Candidatus Aminicenantes bacterium]